MQEPISYPGNVTLSKNTDKFDTAASWADSIKLISNQPTVFDHQTCHYLDLPLDKNMVGTMVSDMAALSAFNIAMETHKINSVTCLKSAIKSLMDPSQKSTQQAIALRFLMHIVGDMTQPLHNASLEENGENDKGGNYTNFPSTIWIPTTNGSGSPQSKLHALWDGTLGAFLQFQYSKVDSKVGLFSKSDLALNIYFGQKLQNQKTSRDIFNAVSESTPSFEDWVIDGYRIAVKSVYSDLNQPWGTYSVLRYDIINAQIAKGGYRLSFLLDAIFDPANSTLEFQKLVYDIKNNASIKPFILQ